MAEPGEEQQLRPERFFGAEQQVRFADLMAQWREKRDTGGSLTPELRAELNALIDAEVRASGQRAAALLNELKRSLRAPYGWHPVRTTAARPLERQTRSAEECSE